MMLLTLRETAARLKVGRSTVLKLRDAGKLKRVDLPGVRRAFILEESVNKLILESISPKRVSRI